MKSKDVHRSVKGLPEESRLVHQAVSGDADAFVQLYDAYGDDVYRYIYFRVISDVAAEGITSHVFLYAWEHIESYKKNGSSFVSWIYKIARNQVIDYYKGVMKNHAFDIGSLSAAVDYRFIKEGQDLFNLEAFRNHLKFLTSDIHQTQLQMLTLQSVASYLDYLDPKREIKPSPTFNAYTRSWLTRYVQFHARHPQRPSFSWRRSLAFTGLIAAFLITGTAKAQSALPGELLYGWKRTSEQAWLSLSPDPVGTDIIFADRRLNEWITVQNDPARNANASNDYFNALTKLQSTGNVGTRVRIIPVLKAHRQKLKDAGLSTSSFDNYLIVGANPIPGLTPFQVSLTEIVPPATEVPGEGASKATKVPTKVAPTPTEVPTEVTSRPTGVLAEITSTPTGVPTEITSTPTGVPTEVTSTPTGVPTEVAPTPTEVPNEVAPPPTEAPTEVVPPPTKAPTEVAPPPTEAPVVPTEIPQTIPTDANP